MFFVHVVFVLLSAGVYIFNDLMDLELDRNHPVKKNRPLASGELSVPTAVGGGLLGLALALGMAVYLGRTFFGLALGYLVLNIAYSLWLKHKPYVDVLTIAVGFLLRILAGCFAIRLPVDQISYFLVLCTFLLAFYLGLGKRRHELVLLENAQNDKTLRPVLRYYKRHHIDSLLRVLMILILLVYSFYTVAPRTRHYFGTMNLVFTIPFVAFGLYRFNWILMGKDGPESPTDFMVKDWPFMVNLLLWSITVVVVLYVV
jgi:4-hydroxybenzoate polyprenyltransferase